MTVGQMPRDRLGLGLGWLTRSDVLENAPHYVERDHSSTSSSSAQNSSAIACKRASSSASSAPDAASSGAASGAVAAAAAGSGARFDSTRKTQFGAQVVAKRPDKSTSYVCSAQLRHSWISCRPGT